MACDPCACGVAQYATTQNLSISLTIPSTTRGGGGGGGSAALGMSVLGYYQCPTAVWEPLYWPCNVSRIDFRCYQRFVKRITHVTSTLQQRSPPSVIILRRSTSPKPSERRQQGGSGHPTITIVLQSARARPVPEGLELQVELFDVVEGFSKFKRKDPQYVQSILHRVESGLKRCHDLERAAAKQQQDQLKCAVSQKKEKRTSLFQTVRERLDAEGASNLNHLAQSFLPICKWLRCASYVAGMLESHQL